MINSRTKQVQTMKKIETKKKPKSDDVKKDFGNFEVEDHIKIFDPETNEVYVSQR